MAGPTIHQRVSGWLWHWKTGPPWVQDVFEMRKLVKDGMRYIKVQLEDDGPIPLELCAEWRAAGLKVWGAVGHVDGRDPYELAAWLRAERYRLGLAGLDFNFEEDVKRMDVETGGEWSLTFCSNARNMMPVLPMAIDTFYGSAAAMPGMNLGTYLEHGCRLCLQSYWGQTGIWNDPPTRMVEWTSGASPPWPKAKVKPLHRVVAPDEGEDAGKLPDWNEVFRDSQRAGTKGVGWYHIDGADFELLRWLTRTAIAKGIAY